MFFLLRELVNVVLIAGLVSFALIAKEPTGFNRTGEALSVEQELASVQILKISLPKSELFTLKKLHTENNHHRIERLEELTKSLLSQNFLPELEELRFEIQRMGLDQNIASHLIALIDELAKPHYSSEEIRDYLKWDLTLTLTFLKGESSIIKSKVDQFHSKILEQNYNIVLRDSFGHSPSYFLIDQLTSKPFAILKQSSPEFFSSFQRLLPGMPLTAPVWEHERVGFEQDQFFGFDHTPTTLVVHFQNHLGERVNGSVQEFIHDSKAGVEFYDLKGARMLLDISKSHVQNIALSGFFKGLTAGHMTNYLLQLQSDGKAVTSIFEIDLEEMLLPYNQLSNNHNLIDLMDPAISEKELAAHSIILCRMWILGLPQNAQVFDRAALIVMSNPVLLPLLQHYQEETPSIDRASWIAQYERTLQMQKISLEELKKDEVTLTPRELYFKLFGGAHLWKIAQEKRYPAAVAFNHLISDPYQHILKNFAHPETIPQSRLLDAPREATEESVELFLFFQKMQELRRGHFKPKYPIKARSVFSLTSNLHYFKNNFYERHRYSRFFAFADLFIGIRFFKRLSLEQPL